MTEDTLNIYEKKAQEMTATNMITREDTFAKTKGGFLCLDCNGEHYDRVRISRLFPFSDADRYLSVREYGNGDKEIGIIEELASLSEETQKPTPFLTTKSATAASFQTMAGIPEARYSDSL